MIGAVRRVVAGWEQRVEELQASLERVETETLALLEAGQRHIDHLEAQLAAAQARAEAQAAELAQARGQLERQAPRRWPGGLWRRLLSRNGG